MYIQYYNIYIHIYIYIDCKVKTPRNISSNLSPPDTHSLSSILYLLACVCVCVCKQNLG